MTRPIAIVCTQSDLVTDYRIHKMSVTLEEAGFDVRYLTRSHSKHMDVESDVKHIMKLVFERGPLFYLEFNIRLFIHLLFCRAKLIVSIDLDTLAGCYMASALSSKELLFDSHEYFPESPEIAHKPFVKWVWNKVQDIYVPHVRHAVTVCQSIADIFKTKYQKDFLVVRNVPLSGRDNVGDAAERMDGHQFTILYQGAVNIGRGIETVIEALPRLPECRFLVVGDGDILDEVKALSVEYGVNDRVEFTGRLPFSQLGPHMLQSDLGICFFENLSLNYYYCLPNRLFDFIQAGLPFMAIDFPEIKRIVEGYDVGVCMSEVSVDNVVSAVRHAMYNPDIVQKWRDNMKRASLELTWENDTRRLVEELKGIANGVK